MTQKKYKCEVYICNYKTVIVTAKNAGQAKGKAHKKVAAMKIGTESIDKQYTDPECE